MRVLHAVVAMALLLLPSCTSHERVRPARHLVLVTIDTLRQDRLGTYGRREAHTPNIDALAARGIRFDDAIAQAISTPPSHASILCGVDPVAHGVSQLYGQRLPDEQQTLAEILGDEGFETAAFVSALPLLRAVGLDQGFTVYDDDLPPGIDRVRRAGATNARVRRWLAKEHAARVFLWVHYFDPHFPYAPPARFRAAFVEPGAPSPRSQRLGPDSDGLPQAVVRAGAALYQAEVAYTDAAFGALLDALRRAGILEDAVVALVADHGESLGERGDYFGHWDVFDDTARVPMILAHPDGRGAGTAIRASVGTIDLLPTVLSWLGVAAPDGLDGVDLSPLLDGRPADPGRVFYTERGRGPGPTVRSVRDDRWLLIRGPRPADAGGGSVDRLYERATGAEVALERAGRLSALLDRYVERARALRPQPPIPVEPEVAQGLRSLGYVVPENGP